MLRSDLRDPVQARRAVEGEANRWWPARRRRERTRCGGVREVQDLDPDTPDELFLTNVFTPVYVCRAACEHLGRGGIVVNVSGARAETPLPGNAAYATSTAALHAFDVSLACEARGRGALVVDARPPHTESGLSLRPIAGDPPKLPRGIEADTVSERIVDAVIDGEAHLPSAAFP